MRVRITVGDVELRLDGLELTPREVRALMRHAAGIALAVAPETPVAVDVEEPRSSLGFTAHLELDTARHDPPSMPWWDDEDRAT
jgi:hypothetical protein